MSIFWLSSIVILWAAVLFVGFLLLGTLRALGLLTWRLEQLEATTPKRLGRDGLKPGKKAPDFSLPSVNGEEDGKAVSLNDFAGRKVLLVFTQSGCSPCQKIVPELNRLAPVAVGRISNPSHPQVLVVNNGDAEATRKWSEEVGARFPVLVQTQFNISKKYEVFATPFAFLIDEKGIIASKGIINNRQHIGYVLSGARPSEPGALATGDGQESNGHIEDDPSGADGAASQESVSHSISSKEISHV
jgi:methylamine dehydrogenase accessory protein MauD